MKNKIERRLFIVDVAGMKKLLVQKTTGMEVNREKKKEMLHQQENYN